MGMYRKEWNCCNSVTETDAWEPEDCPFCTPPPQRKPMTDEEIGAMWVTARRNSPVPHVVFARAIEAAHSIYAPAELKENT